MCKSFMVFGRNHNSTMRCINGVSEGSAVKGDNGRGTCHRFYSHHAKRLCNRGHEEKIGSSKDLCDLFLVFYPAELHKAIPVTQRVEGTLIIHRDNVGWL